MIIHMFTTRFVIETMLEELKVGVENQYQAEQKAIMNLCKSQGKVCFY